MKKLTNSQRANLAIFLLMSGYENAEGDKAEHSISIRNGDNELVATIVVIHGDRYGTIIDASMGNNDQALITIAGDWVNELRLPEYRGGFDTVDELVSWCCTHMDLIENYYEKRERA